MTHIKICKKPAPPFISTIHKQQTTNFTFSKLIFLFPAFFKICTDLVPRLGCWYAAVRLHNYLLTNIVRLPSNFFDVTPTGRILSRFSKDIDVVDSSLAPLICDFVICALEVKKILYTFLLLLLFNSSFLTKFKRFSLNVFKVQLKGHAALKKLNQLHVS